MHDFNRFAAARDRLSAGRGGPGVVYVIRNETFDELVKIGYSTRSGAARARELNDQRYAGTPGKYECVYERRVADPIAVERVVHAVLSANWVGREWFRCEVDDARRAIDDAAPALHIMMPRLRVERRGNLPLIVIGQSRWSAALDLLGVFVIGTTLTWFIG